MYLLMYLDYVLVMYYMWACALDFMMGDTVIFELDCYDTCARCMTVITLLSSLL